VSYLESYFRSTPEPLRTKAAIACLAALDHVKEASPLVAKSIVQELKDQRSRVKLIASENYCSLAVQLAMGNWLTDKYCEGAPGRRFYAGCENVDVIEQSAVEELKQLFGCDHAYVQPHSGIDANMVATWAILLQKVQSKELERLGKKNVEELTEEEHEKVRQLLINQKIMGLSLSSGGHLTHGYRHNVSSKIMKSVPYHVDAKTGLLDYAALQKQVEQEKPLVLLAGYSAYPRRINFAKMKEIADSVQAVLFVDMAHFAGLVAGKVLQGDYDPVPFADLVTSTTHKTLRGPRGGIVLCKKEWQETVDKGCPMVLGGPLPHVMAAKAIAFKEARQPSFKKYAQQVVNNASALAQEFSRRGVAVTTGGTDNHLLVVDVMKSFGLTGRQAETGLAKAGWTVNRNAIPFDPQGPWYTSGIRLGTAAVTTLGMREQEMQEIAENICKLLQASRALSTGEGVSRSQVVTEESLFQEIKREGQELLSRFPLYPELRIEEETNEGVL